jgi:large subunit ribosomal protein L4
MVKVTTYDAASGATGEKDFSANLGEKILYRTMKDAIVQYQANRRQGDAHTKTRTELAGHAKKPWKQKKTGRARAGDRRSPLWVGGATTFGPRNTRRWSYHLPRQQRTVALRSALAGKLQDGEIREVTGLSFDAPSSKAARAILAGATEGGSVLILTSGRDQNVWKSFRNFQRVSVRTAAETNSYDLLAHKWVLVQEGALEVLAGRVSVGDEG